MAAVSNYGTDYVVATEMPNVTAVLPPTRSRISWGAVIAGVVIAIILQIAMNMLGLSIGAAAMDPDSTQAVGPAFGTATVLWMAASIFISLFVGGAVAGYMSGRIGRNEGMIHGLTVWAVATILSLMMLTSAAGAMLNGITNVLGQGLSLLGSTAADVVPGVANSLNLQDSLLASINEEAGAIQPMTTSNGSSTGTDATGTNGTTNNAMTGDQTAAPRAMNAPLVMEIGNLLGAEAGSPEATTARTNAMTLLTNTGITEAEATATLDRWENDFRAIAAQASERAEQAAEDVANAVAATAGIAFMVIALGALAAGAGGFLGSPETFVDASRRRSVTGQND